MNSMDPNLWELIKAGDPEDEIAAIVRLREAGVYPEQIRVISELGKIVTCRLKRADITKVRTDSRVMSLKAPEPIVPEQEINSHTAAENIAIAQSDQRRPDNLSETGRGIVIGVIDWGCDFAHPSFRNNDGSTRLLALWDQSSQTDQQRENRYGYGNIYTSEDINLALTTLQPYAALGYHPGNADPNNNGSHGTHVLDIAAGNGRGGGIAGIAPEADLIFVHLITRGTDGLSNLGDSATLLEAVDFIAQTAGNRPWVINMSIGNIAGSHDGTTLVEQGLDEAILAAPGRAICQSCGNYLNRKTHSARQVRPGEQISLYWQTEKADVTPNELEIWYSSRDRFAVEVCSPNGLKSESVALGEQMAMTIDDQEICRIYHRSFDPNNLDHHINIFIYPGAPAGLWVITITGEDVVDGRIHAWIERDEACRDCQSYFSQEQAVPFSTTGTICNGFRTIAVGAYNPHTSSRELAHFSSMGPTRDGRQKPDLVAPGVDILAARSAPRTDAPQREPDLLTYKSGTSMASPHVTGTIALMFEAAQRPLTIHETRRLLLTSATLPDNSINGEFATRIGSGYLDIVKAVKETKKYTKLEKGKVMATNQTEYQEQLSYDNGTIEVSDYLKMPYINEMESNPLSKYGVVIGSKENSNTVRDELRKIAKHYLDQNDLRWSFPYVYSLVTSEVSKGYEQGIFKGGDAVLHWVANFYELYALNLKAWIESGKAESPWQTVFTESNKLLQDSSPWGARSAATFILGMFAHIKSDLPRALAYVFLKFFLNGSNPATGQVWTFDDLKADFDIMNTKVFPSVIDQVNKDGVVLPSITNVWPGFRDWYLNQRLPLTKERDDAWKVGRTYANDSTVIAWVQTLPMHRKPTRLTLTAQTSVGSTVGKGGSVLAQGISNSINQLISGIKSNLKKVGEEISSEQISSLSECASCQQRENHKLEVIDPIELSMDIETLRPATFNLVEFADEVVNSQQVLGLETLLNEAYSKSNATGSANIPDNLPSLTEIFDAFVYGKATNLLKKLKEYFKVIAFPGRRLKEFPQSGDLMIRRGEANLAHLAMIATPEIWRKEQLADVGLLAESPQPGWYMQVIDGGSHPHLRQNGFARLILKEDGYLPYNQILLRLKVIPSQTFIPSDDQGSQSAERINRYAMHLIPPSAPQRLEHYLQRQLQPYKIPFLLRNSAIEILRAGKYTIIKDPCFVVEPNDRILLTQPPPDSCLNEFDRIPNSEYRDYALASVGDTFDQLFHIAFEVRPETISAPINVRSLTDFIESITDRVIPLPSTTKTQPSHPIRNIYLVSHAFLEGNLKVKMKDSDDDGIDYEILEKAKKQRAIFIQPGNLIPRPKDSAGRPIAPNFHIKGCRIGLAIPFLQLLKEALGGGLTITGPKHYSVVAQSLKPDGIIEYMLYGFRLYRATKFKSQMEAIQGFTNNKFIRVDSSIVPDSFWRQAIPREIHQKEFNVKEPVIFPVTNHAIEVDRTYLYKEQVIFDGPEAVLKIDSNPDSDEKRKKAIKEGLSKFPEYTPQHPFPKYVRLGYKSLDEFMDGCTWNFRWEAAEKKLLYRATRHIYTVRAPIVDPSTNNLFVNFYPSAKNGTFITQLNENDTRFFAKV